MPAVYVISGGRAYARNKVDTSAYAAYGPWQLLGLEKARLITAVRTETGHMVFVQTETGELLSMQRSGDDLNASYGEWASLGQLNKAFVDLDATHGNAGTALYGLEQSGRVVVNNSPASGAIWEEVRASTASPRLVAIAATTTKANDEVFFGITSLGDVYELKRQLGPINQ